MEYEWRNGVVNPSFITCFQLICVIYICTILYYSTNIISGIELSKKNLRGFCLTQDYADYADFFDLIFWDFT